MQGGYLLDLIILKAHISGDFYEDCSRDARQETLAQNPYNTSSERSPRSVSSRGTFSRLRHFSSSCDANEITRNGSIVDTGRCNSLWNPPMKIKGTHFLVAEEVDACDEDTLHSHGGDLVSVGCHASYRMIK